MASKHITAKTQRLCGHSDQFSFDKFERNRIGDGLYAANTLCGECRKHISALAAPLSKGFYPVQLPTLLGTSAQCYAAKKIRLEAIRAVGPIMGALAKSDALYASHALAAYEMLFKITDSRFWIENQFPFNASWLCFEIEWLIRQKKVASIRPCKQSAFEYWLNCDREVIRVALSKVKPIEPVAAQAACQ